ncbi:MAG: type IV pilus biogenesis/stability protein PilW [Steroidobacteraceae bacterium]
MRAAAILWMTTLVTSVLLAACGGSEPVKEAVDPTTVSNKDAATFNVQLGLTYLQQGKIELARDKLERALDQNPKDPAVHTGVALLYDRLGENGKAERHFRTALRMRPSDPTVQNYFGVFLCKNRRFEDGEKILMKAAHNPVYQTPEVALSNVGVCERNAGHADVAEGYFLKATQLRPQFAEGWLQLSEVTFLRGDYPKAREYLQRHLNLVRVSATALWLGLRIERALGNVKQVEAYSRRLKTEFPNADETRTLLEQERKSG